MKTFKQYIGRSRVNEGISHIDDLSVDEFVSAVENIDKQRATNKLDGTNMWFGLDEDGKFYTSRRGKIKTADRKYSHEEHGETIGTNGIRSAHQALEKHLKIIQRSLEPGDTVESEVLFGAQPNAIEYEDGANSIAIIRGVDGTPADRVEVLKHALSDERSEVHSSITDTEDGKTLFQRSETIEWRFGGVDELDISKEVIASVKAKVAELKSFLASKNETLGVTNGEALKSHKKEAAEIKKALITKINADYKAVIKSLLLDEVKKKSTKKSKDGDVEGAVFSDPESAIQFKVVDKDVFTAINKFNYEVRNNVSGVVKTDDPMADKAVRGGLFGEAKIRMCALFDVKGLAIASGTKRVLGKFKGDSPEETLQNMVKNFENMDTQSVRKKLLAIMGSALDELDEYLEEFKNNSEEYEMELENGRVAKYTLTIVKRTLLNFATTRTIMVELYAKIKNAKSMAELLIALFGPKIKQLHTEQETEPENE